MTRHTIGSGRALFSLPSDQFINASKPLQALFSNNSIEDEMDDPDPINLWPSNEVRAAGWQAECRDADGHLTRTHAPFNSDEDIVWLVREALEHGDTITIWPVAALSGPKP